MSHNITAYDSIVLASQTAGVIIKHKTSWAAIFGSHFSTSSSHVFLGNGLGYASSPLPEKAVAAATYTTVTLKDP